MIKIKLSELIDAYQALKRVGACKIDALAAYKVSMLMVKARDHLVAFDEARDGLLQRLGKSEDGGATFSVEPENQAAMNTEFKALRDAVVEIDAEPIQMHRFAGRELSPDDLATAHQFFAAPAVASNDAPAEAGTPPKVRRR